MLPLPAIAQSLRKQGHKSGTMKGIITEFELDLCIVKKKTLRTSMSQARTDTKMSTAGVREQEETGYVREVKILDEMHKLFIQEIFGKNMGYVTVISHCQDNASECMSSRRLLFQ
jgi:hypothetical protein